MCIFLKFKLTTGMQMAQRVKTLNVKNIFRNYQLFTFKNVPTYPYNLFDLRFDNAMGIAI